MDNPEQLKSRLIWLFEKTDQSKQPELWVNAVWAVSQVHTTDRDRLMPLLLEAESLAEKMKLHQQWVGLRLAFLKYTSKTDNAPTKDQFEILLRTTKLFGKPRLTALVKAEFAFAQVYRNEAVFAMTLIREALQEIQADSAATEYHIYKVYSAAAVVCGFLRDDKRLQTLNNDLIGLARNKNLRAALLNSLYNMIAYTMNTQDSKRIRDAKPLFDEALALALNLNLKMQEGVLRNQLVTYYGSVDNNSQALMESNRALAIFEDLENKIWIADTLTKKARVQIAAGDFTEALSELQQAEKIFPQEYIQDHMRIVELKGIALAKLNRFELAFNAMSEAVGLHKSHSEAIRRQELNNKLAELGAQIEEQKNHKLEKKNAENLRIMNYQMNMLLLGAAILACSALAVWTIYRQKRRLASLNKYITSQVLDRYLPPAVVKEILKGHLKLDTKPTEKYITVLFADICQFTRATEQLGINNISIILNEFLSTMTEIVFKHNGTIDKFIGDSIMVVFGAPTDMTDEEQARQAISTAQDMLVALQELNRSWIDKGMGSFEMHIGIHAGKAIVGNFGSRKRSDYTAIGSTVNIAARLEKIAGGNQVVFSESIRRQLPKITVRCLGRFELKGIQVPVEAYTLVDYASCEQSPNDTESSAS